MNRSNAMPDGAVGYRLAPQQVRIVRLQEGDDPWLPRSVCHADLEGRVDLERLRACVDRLVSVHEILRANVVRPGSLHEPVLRVADTGKIAWLDARQGLVHGAGANPADALAMADHEAEPCVAGGARICAIWSAGEAEERGQLTLCGPSLYLDSVSFEILLSDLCEIYRCPERPLATRIPHFADLAAWQNELLTEPEFDEERLYWASRADPVSSLRAAGSAFRTQSLAFDVPRMTLTALEQTVARWDVSLTASLLGVWLLLSSLHRGHGFGEAAVRFDGRNYEGLEKVVGPFARFLPVRASITQDEPIRSLVARVESCLIEYQDRQEYFDASLYASPGSSHASYLDWAFEFDRDPEPWQLGNAALRISARECHLDRFGLKLSLSRGEERLRARLYFDVGRVTRATALAVADQLQALVRQLAAGDRPFVEDLDPLSERARAEVVDRWSRGPEALCSPALVHEAIWRQAAKTPDRIALVHSGGTLTYAELERKSNRVAGLLMRRGVRIEDPVAIRLDRGADAVIVMLGVLKAGGAYLPIDPKDPPARQALMLREGQARTVISERRLSAGFATFPGDQVFLDEIGDDLESETDSTPGIALDPEQLAYILFTSGSTGIPKGVMVTHRGLASYLAWSMTEYDMANVGSAIVHTPLSSDLSVTALWTPLACGQTVLLARERPGIEGLLEALEWAEEVGLLKLTPTHLRMLNRRADLSELIPHCRTLVIGGEALFGSDVEPWLASGARVRAVNEYGPTETVVGCCLHVIGPDQAPAERVPIGRPAVGCEVHVLDARLRPVPVGVVGEIYVGGVGVARGYSGQPGLTAERFVPHPFAERPGQRLYRTGDLARWRADGSVEYLGRLDDQIKIRGYRVEIGEIESALEQHPDLKDCAVKLHTGQGTPQIVAYVVPALMDRKAPTSVQLRDFLVERLPDYMVPATFVRIDALPLAPSGKVDRKSLPDPAEGEVLHGIAYSPPQTFKQQVLSVIWSRALGVDRVGIHDNYFALGGDSIHAIRVVAEARQKGFELSIEMLFAHPTIGRLSQIGKAAEPVRPYPDYAPFSLIAGADRERLTGAVEDAYPVSRLQAGMIYAMELFAKSAIYHDVASYDLRLKEPINLPLLQSAVDALVARHPALRTCFDLAGFSEPLQLVSRSCSLPITAEDISRLSEPAQERTIQRWMEAEKRRPFDVPTPPLIRIHLHLRGSTRVQFSLGFHHAILDGWSEATLLTELFEHYFSLCRGSEPDPHPIPANLIPDFLRHEQEAIGSTETRRYWRTVLEGAPLLSLPRRREAASPTDGRRGTTTVNVAISEELNHELKRLATELAVPVKTVLLAAHIQALAYLGGEQDVLTAMVASGRPEREGGADVLGLFLNSIPVRVDADAPNCKELVQRCFEAERASLPHRRFPFAEVKSMMGSGREVSQTLFYFTHYHVFRHPSISDEIDVLNDIYYEETTFGFVANFWLNPFSERVHLNITCDATQFSDEQGTGFGGTYQRALQALAEAPDRAPIAADLLSDRERHRLLAEWQGRISQSPAHAALLHELVERQARSTPNAAAIQFRDQTLSYRDLDRRANGVAHGLRHLGVGLGGIVGVRTGRSAAMIVSLLGCLKAGAAYLPVDPDVPEDRLAWIVKECQVRWLLVEREPETPLPHGCRPVLVGSRPDDIPWPPQEQPPDLDRFLDAPAYVLYTSGSTGWPKGVANSHRAIVNRLLWMQQEYQLCAEDLVLQKTPYTFDVSLWEIFWPLTQGVLLVVAEPERHADPIYLAHTVEDCGITTLHFVPSMLRVFLAAVEPARLTSLKRVIVSGETLDRQLHDRFFELLPAVELHNLYGPTEAAIDVTAWPCRPGGGERIVPIGRPISNIRIYILDPWLRPAPIGTKGEIHIAGIGLALGYWGRSELTAEQFLPNPFAAAPGERMYCTGDLGRWRADGTIEFLGRIDDQLKLRGYRIEPAEIEGSLCEHPSVHRAAVVSVRRNGEDMLVAFVVPQPAVTIDVRELRRFLLRRLPLYMVPALFECVDSLPCTSSGKLDRAALKLPAEERAQPTSQDPSLMTPLEEVLCGIWSEVLGVGEIAPQQNFFELGGHSIAATRIVALLRSRLDVDLPLRRLLDTPTIREFARSIEGARCYLDGDPSPLIEPRGRDQPIPLSLAQQRLWFLEELNPGTVTFVLPGAFELHGRLAPQALQSALLAVVARHEILRTSFKVEQGQVLQTVADTSSVCLNMVDLGDIPEPEAADLAKAIAEGEAQRPFDLTEQPLLRATLIRMSDARHLFVVTLHHIIADGWSLAHFAMDLEASYRTELAGGGQPLPPLPLQYGDYAVWERASGRRSRSHDEADLRFWQGQLRAPLPILHFPGQLPDCGPSGVHSRTVRFGIEKCLVEQLRDTARREGCTLFIVLMAGFKAQLNALTGSEDIAVMTDAGNRYQPQTQNMIGMFVNQLLLRDDLSGNPTLRTVLRRIRDNSFDAYAHQSVPFEQLVHLTASEDDAARRSLAGIPKLVLQNHRLPNWALAGLSVRPFEVDRFSAKIDLLINLREEGEGLRGWLEYRESRFDEPAVDSLVFLYRQALSFLANRLEADLAEMRAFLRDERDQRAAQIARKLSTSSRDIFSRARRQSM